MVWVSHWDVESTCALELSNRWNFHLSKFWLPCWREQRKCNTACAVHSGRSEKSELSVRLRAFACVTRAVRVSRDASDASPLPYLCRSVRWCSFLQCERENKFGNQPKKITFSSLFETVFYFPLQYRRYLTGRLIPIN